MILYHYAQINDYLCLNIGAAQRVEHYEIAGYGTANNFARQLGLTEVSSLLSKTEEEEKATDELLNKLAKTEVNEKARLVEKREH